MNISDSDAPDANKFVYKIKLFMLLVEEIPMNFKKGI